MLRHPLHFCKLGFMIQEFKIFFTIESLDAFGSVLQGDFYLYTQTFYWNRFVFLGWRDIL